MVLSLEMFERDVQHVLDEYAAGVIPLKDLIHVRPFSPVSYLHNFVV